VPAPDVRFDHLYGYEELTSTLHALAGYRPDLVTVESIGRSYEGREIWLATVTNTAIGPHHEKPAVWVGANIHSTEHTGALAALHLVHLLVTGHGDDADVTRAVDSRTFYVVPRVNPDGAELALATPPTYVRSSVRRWPRTDDAPGLEERDIDGDGRILAMRVPDENGAWKVSDRDPRLMVLRAPDEDGPGPYFRLLPEGTIRDFDGVRIELAPERRSLDLNRNFPVRWRPHGEQHGAGPFPVSEPETRVIADAVVARTNICCYFCHHTFGAVILRPFDDQPDEAMPTKDLQRYKVLGGRGAELTGYRHVSVFHDFRYDPKDVTTGSEDTWAYDNLGAYAWTSELWSPIARAGITDYHLIDWFREHPIDDDLTLLRFNDEQLGGAGFIDWYAFEHPQLGPVELGGWDDMRFWGNPPDALLEAEVAPHSRWELFCALTTPVLRLRAADVEPAGPRSWRIRVVVENAGWLPTNVTERAVERKAVDGVEATIGLPDGVRLVGGQTRLDLGQLQGRSESTSMTASFGAIRPEPTVDRGVAEWVVEGEPGAAVTVEVRHPRAGVVRAALTLG
jgi:murein tripeptide amidase MpaA